MTIKMKQSLPPEIDTNMGSDKLLPPPGGYHSKSGNSFREADTPKHCNTGEKARPNGSSSSQFQPPLYSQYSQPGQPGQPGPHPPSMPGNYYGHGHPQPPHPASGHNSTVMVSPGGPGYNNYHHGNYYPNHNNNSSRPPYPPYGNQPHMPYNNGNYPPSYVNPNDRHHAFNPHGSYQNQNHNQSQNQNQHQNQNQSNSSSHEFSRAISSSFSEGTTTKVKRSESFQNNVFDTRDDLSIGAESDASWKQGLNQVASIEEDTFEARNGATTPVESICPNLSPGSRAPKHKRSPLPRKPLSARPLQKVSSFQEPFDMSSRSKDDLDLRICETGSSSFLFGEDSSHAKRPRERRDDKPSNDRRNLSPPMNFHHLSMKEVRDAPPPSKKNRCSSIAEERELYNTFSIDSMNSFGKEGNALPDFGEVTKKHNPKPVSKRQSFDERDGAERDLRSSMPSWDIAGQDSFGGGFSVSSNLSEGNADAVLGKSFSFTNDDEFSTANQSTTEIKGIPEELEKADPLANLNPSESIDLTRGTGPHPSPRENFPPNSATWVTNASSRGGSFSMDSSSGPNQHFPPPPPPPPPNSRFGSMPPQYHDSRHPYHPPGPYGLPPRQNQPYLPSSFHPPPSGMAGPPMNRTAPPPVYMMSSASHAVGNVDGMGGMKRSISKLSNSGTFNWTKSDDTRLQDIMKKFKNPKDWEAIAAEFGAGRTAKECNERWIRYLKPGVRKGQWQDHEDTIVIEAVTTCKEQPFTRWSDLAQKLPGRVGKQIRDRWVNHLNPNINHMPFTKEDDSKLWNGHKQLGKRWVEISTKFFNSSRSENHIKNRWYSASFKKFVATEFGPNAYVPCDKKGGGKKGSGGKTKSPAKK